MCMPLRIETAQQSAYICQVTKLIPIQEPSMGTILGAVEMFISGVR